MPPWGTHMNSGVHERGFWTDASKEGHYYDTRLSRALCKFFDGHSVVDMGCGTGRYVSAMRAAGIDCDGVDGNPLTAGPGLSVADLSTELRLPRTYDWVLSMEVGEHIPRQYEGTFIGNLNRHARLGIVLSWASPGQPGRGHVNERTSEYLADIMSGLGYYPCWDWEAAFRQQARLPWLKTTIMVFRRLAITPAGAS